MPPKCKFTKEDVIAAALALIREDGLEALTARGLAARLGLSAKPIFGLFSGMEEVQAAVIAAANTLYQSYINTAMTAGEYPPYKASGMAYIRFAQEEKALFRLLFMRDRSGETVKENREDIRPMLDMLMQNLGLSEDMAYIFHIELWVYVHGIAVMIATGYLDWDVEFISRALTDAYIGLKLRYTEG